MNHPVTGFVDVPAMLPAPILFLILLVCVDLFRLYEQLFVHDAKLLFQVFVFLVEIYLAFGTSRGDVVGLPAMRQSRLS